MGAADAAPWKSCPFPYHMPLITVASLAATRRHVRQQASVFFLSWHDFFFYAKLSYLMAYVARVWP